MGIVLFFAVVSEMKGWAVDVTLLSQYVIFTCRDGRPASPTCFIFLYLSFLDFVFLFLVFIVHFFIFIFIFLLCASLYFLFF